VSKRTHVNRPAAPRGFKRFFSAHDDAGAGGNAARQRGGAEQIVDRGAFEAVARSLSTAALASPSSAQAEARPVALDSGRLHAPTFRAARRVRSAAAAGRGRRDDGGRFAVVAGDQIGAVSGSAIESVHLGVLSTPHSSRPTPAQPTITDGFVAGDRLQAADERATCAGRRRASSFTSRANSL
jgi:hypothetical protein